MKTFLFASDLHGDKQNPDAVEAMLKHCDELKPDVRVFGGDLFDFSPLMRSADSAEKNESMSADVEAGLEFLEKFQPNHFLLGNHDDRLWLTAKKSSIGIVRDTANMGIKDITNRCRRINCKMYPYDVEKGVLRMGKLTFLHGYYHGITATKRHAETFSQPGGLVVHGHIHSLQMHTIPRVGGGAGISAGCLATTRMEWNKAKVNRLAHECGWVYGEFSNKGWVAYMAKKVEDTWRWR